MKRVDLKGEKFNNLIVIELHSVKNGKSMWLCQCKCGGKTVVEGYELKSGHTKSCGCYKHNPSSKRIDITGKKYHNFTVLGPQEFNNQHLRWECKCDCGKIFYASSQNIRLGKTKNCGCIKTFDHSTQNGMMKHGMSRKSEYNTWLGLKARCLNIKNNKYKDYGGRGITVCDRWINSFENFYSDMGTKPSPTHSLDRIDVNGDYTPENCRWATTIEQSNNKQNTVMVLNIYTGVYYDSVLEAAKSCEISANKIRQNIDNVKYNRTNFIRV